MDEQLKHAVERAIYNALTKDGVFPNSVAYTIPQAAAACGLTESSIRQAIARGEIVAKKRGGRWLIRRDDLLRWLE